MRWLTRWREFTVGNIRETNIWLSNRFNIQKQNINCPLKVETGSLLDSHGHGLTEWSLTAGLWTRLAFGVLRLSPDLQLKTRYTLRKTVQKNIPLGVQNLTLGLYS